VNRGESNTTTMLTGLLNSLGYHEVHVSFVDPAAAA
jgi:hypothetical protein